MTETQSLSIEEVRALVAERTRYDDWLSALEAKREETPARVFERVHGDYSARRKDVSVRLRAHVPDLSAMAGEMHERLRSLESTLETLQDERAEAMLRTAVGEFDDHRWEQVRQQVESQIGELGHQREAMSAEADEVRSLLESAKSGPDFEEAALPAEVVADVTPEPQAEAASPVDEVVEVPIIMEVASPALEATDDFATVDTFGITATTSFDEPAAATTTASGLTSSVGSSQPTDEELAELDNALAMFSNDAPVDGYRPAVATPSLNGVDVFDDADLGDLRMDPPRATAVATPADAQAPIDRDVHGVPRSMSEASAPARADGFDDLAFLRSVVDPSSGNNATRTAAGGDQLKTLRCTECSTMNFPTEWYCERCGGELAAF
ncbi:MAG: hypothetical protein IT353_01040 [Gemmatimonadaceae bacterium]|nr:hypothetical protein [Gemmatimonadaceae bacterium]